MEATRAPMAEARGAMTSSICAASSRVGTRTSAVGRRRPRRPAAGLAASRARIARPNASVLPDPVGAMPQTSRPARESGKVAAWIGNAVVIPRCSRAVDSTGGTPRSEKRTGARVGVDGFMRLQSVQWKVADSMDRLVGPAGTSFASRRRATARGMSGMLAHFAGLKGATSQSRGSVEMSRIVGDMPGSVGEDSHSRRSARNGPPPRSARASRNEGWCPTSVRNCPTRTWSGCT